MAATPALMTVDDEPENLELVERILGERFDVRAFTSPVEALAAMRSQHFDVVISDHRMPVMSGVELLTRASQLQPDSVRMLLTGYADVETAVEAVNRGRVSSIVRKPVEARALLDEVQRSYDFRQLFIENRSLTRELQRSNHALSEAKRLLELDLDARSRELTLANQQLAEIATRDGLTGLYNHRYFQDRADAEVAAALRYGHPLSLLFLDVDHFKAYNDHNGHPAGDQLLARLGQLLGRGRSGAFDGLRECDLAARYGGEEFVVLLPNTTREKAAIVAERLAAALAKSDLPGGASQPLGRVTMSIGIAELPRDARSKQELIQKADDALFRAKRDGRDRVKLATLSPPVEGAAPPSAEDGGSRAALQAALRDERERREAAEAELAGERAMREEIERSMEEMAHEMYVAALAKLKEQQAMLLHSEKLSALGRMSAGIAHEINNALNFMQGNIQHLPSYVAAYEAILAAYREAVAHDADAVARLQAIEKSKRLPYIQKDLPKLLGSVGTGLSRAGAIVRDMGIFVHAERADAMEAFEIRRAVEVALTLGANRLKNRASVHTAFQTGRRALGNAGRLSQVFLNLLGNASDAMVEAGDIFIEVTDTGDQVLTTIRDTGSGIPRELQGRMFEPFFTTKPPGEGTGLGLFTCRQIVEQHGGKLWFESTPGVGTTFFVALPGEGAPAGGAL